VPDLGDPSDPSDASGPGEALLAALAYHDRTKHEPGRYARGPGGLDWATQPDPFRRYQGAPTIELGLVPPTESPSFEDVLARSAPTTPLGPSAIAQLFFDALALSAWKVAGSSRWALRVNPSSGNLHPTEGYLICGPESGLAHAPAVFHYAPEAHALELRRALSAEDHRALVAGLEPGAFFLALTSIHWREAWKYGERAFRYCQHDVGHAIAQLALAASALGLHVRLCASVGDAELAALLGIHDQRGPDAEHPDCLLLVGPSREAVARADDLRLPDAVIERLRAQAAVGIPNVLSAAHRDWPIIDAVAAATTFEGHAAPALLPPARPATQAAHGQPGLASARRLFRQRRSAVAMDGHTTLPASAFFAMMRDASGAGPPFDALPWRPLVDLVLFVHRVDGLEPGLYLLARDAERLPRLRAACKAGFGWTTPPGCPEGLALYQLVATDARHAAQIASCGQEIAADGAFAVGMLADYAGPLHAHGPWLYRRMFWETGAIGQLLYLEAEAYGVRGTGIGCFFDDVMHDVLGLTGDAHQNLYNFTIGGPVEDRRISTEVPYAERGLGLSSRASPPPLPPPSLPRS
jgi:SagB-type dehydrogenase family enzyme